MEVGFLIDRLTALMMVVVTFVSLMVHVYTIGYMHDDDGYSGSSATSPCSLSRC
jgi:NADH-quinone oxidoreductase subunit L